MNSWIRCAAYFSETVRHGPFWIRIEDSRIAEIRSDPPEDATNTDDDQPDVYLLPLLSDTHAHVYMNPWPIDPSQRSRPGSDGLVAETRNAADRLRAALAKGIGFVRDMGDPFGINLAVRDIARASGASYPAYQAPGPAIHRPRKYGRFLGVARSELSEILALVDELAESKSVDFIKIVTTGIVDFATCRVKQSPQYTIDELKAVTRRAERHGLAVASHCSGDNGIDINLAGGVHFIEHAYFVRPDQLLAMRDQGANWTPTFAPVYQQAHYDECGWDAQAKRILYRILHDHNDAIRRGHALGAPILAGTDAGSPGVSIGDGLFVELAALARSLPTAEVLRIATSVNAAACRPDGYTGRIEVGHPASFAAYARPPWQDLSQLGHPVHVYHHGAQVGADLRAVRAAHRRQLNSYP